MSELTVRDIFEDLSLANDYGDRYGYGYDEKLRAITVEAYSDDGDIEATYTVTLTIKEKN